MKKGSRAKSEEINVRPIGDRVLVKPLRNEDKKTASGIIIPETAQKEKPERGTVVAVGDGHRNEKGDILPLRVKVGDVIIYGGYGNEELEIADEKYYLVSESNILAVCK